MLNGVPSVDQARAWVGDLGPVAPIVFAVAFAALTLTPFPKSVLAVVAGALWGLVPGLLICLAAVLMGASAAFVVGRRLLGDAVRTLAGPQMIVIDDAARRSTFLAVLAVRIIPVLPFTIMNFAFGVTRVRFAPFFLGTAVGTIPGTGAYVAVGAFGADPLSWQFWLALGAVASMTLIGLLVARRRYRALHPGTPDDRDTRTRFRESVVPHGRTEPADRSADAAGNDAGATRPTAVREHAEAP